MKRKALACGLGVALCVSLSAAGTKYEPTWASLDARPTPQWFHDAKFGIFIHWGVYSVPAWAPRGKYAEWYWHHMHNKKGATWKYHAATFGADFAYQQFAPMFRAERYDPDAWADLFARSGARYVVLTSKHHDGYCLWPAPDSKGWNSADVGPKRDVLGDLTAAVRKRGLKMGFYYSLYEWYHPLYLKDVRRYVAEHMLPQLKDLVQRYAPDVVWTDGEWSHPDTVWRSTEFLAWLFNESACRNTVAVNDRWGKGCRGRHGGYYTSEYGGHGGKIGAGHVWEECQGIGRSFGYNRNEGPGDYRSATQLIRLLVDCVSNGGCLLLDIGPAADGTIPVVMQQRLLAMGRWLKANGESIYGASAGPLRKQPWGRCTAKPGKLYLHHYQWPNETLSIRGLANKVQRAYLLADPKHEPLALTRDGEALTIALPAHRCDPHDTVVVLEIEGEVEIDTSIRQAADGSVALAAAQATIHGSTARYESGGGKDNIGFWSNPKDWVSWEFTVTRPGVFRVEVAQACVQGSGGSDYTVAIGSKVLKAKVKDTGSWTRFTAEALGSVKLDNAGRYTLSVKPRACRGEGVMNLRSVRLRLAE